MCIEPSHFKCQVLCARLCTDSSTFLEEARGTHPIPVPQSIMDRRSDIQTLWIQQSIYHIKKLTSFNKCEAFSYIMPLLLITLFSLPSATFPKNNLPVPQYSMDRRSNMQTLWMQQSISQIKKLTSFNKCAALSYIIPWLLITLLSPTSSKFPQINLGPR